VQFVTSACRCSRYGSKNLLVMNLLMYIVYLRVMLLVDIWLKI